MSTRFIVILALCVAAGAGATELEVSAQGVLTSPAAASVSIAPDRATTLEVVTRRGDLELRRADLVVTDRDGRRHDLRDVDGATFLAAAHGRIVAIDPYPGLARVRVLDLDGRELHVQRVANLTDPALAPDGASLAYRGREGTTVMDLGTFAARLLPQLAVFAVGPQGRIAGTTPQAPTVVVVDPGQPEARTLDLTAPVRAIAWSPDGEQVWILGERALWRCDVTSGQVADVRVCDDGAELRDLRVEDDSVVLGVRHLDGARASGEMLVLDARGALRERHDGPAFAMPTAPCPEKTHASIPWPLQPNQQHAIGNTYGEYQNYGSSYLHPGFDIFGAAGQPVYAVADGVVKAILTTSADYHWRIAIGQPGSGTSEGYLYAHVDHPTIAVTVGQTVTAGQYLGGLVEWPIYDFTHCHFGRIQDTGSQWFGSWLNVDNPNLDLQNRLDPNPPVFEPAHGTDMFAFCTNQTSSYQDPAALHGAVDIIAHVGDTILSSWVCAVQEIRYSIFPAGHPEAPIVDDKLAVNFDMVLDTYQDGVIDQFLVHLLYKQDATCNTQGDYDNREFYHIITNSNGDDVYDDADLAEAWDTSLVYDGDYVVRVTARDAAGNAATAEMTVTTQNGNLPTATPDGLASALALSCHPNPGPAGVVLRYALARAGAVTLAVYDLAGRRVRELVTGGGAAGAHEIRWDGRDDHGAALASGTYLLKLTSAAGVRTQKFVLAR